MKTKIMNYDEAKAYLKPLGLKSKAEYEAWWNANKPDFLPQFPEVFYGSEPIEKVETEAKQRTLDEVMKEIRDIIDNTHWVQTRLSRMEARGYQIEYCWVKFGGIASIWYMKQNKELKIQVAASESHGKYHKAFCVIIPEKEVDLHNFDISTIRNMQKK